MLTERVNLLKFKVIFQNKFKTLKWWFQWFRVRKICSYSEVGYPTTKGVEEKALIKSLQV